MELACLAACIHAHKLAKVVDEESVDSLESRLMGEESGASEHALVQCATFYHLAGGAEARGLTLSPLSSARPAVGCLSFHRGRRLPALQQRGVRAALTPFLPDTH